MANRYWVGGPGTWDTSSTTNWSASSGGAGGASAPTSADDVYFNSSSGTGNVTISNGNCASIFLSSTTINLVSGTINTYGNQIDFTGFAGSSNIDLNCLWPGPGNAIFNLVSNTVNNITINSSGGGYSQNSAAYFTTDFTLTSGNFNTVGYILAGSRFLSSGTTTRGLNISTSVVTLSYNGNAWSTSNATNFTLTAGSGSVRLSGVNAGMDIGTAGSYSFGNLTYMNTSSTVFGLPQNSCTIGALNIYAPATAGVVTVNVPADHAITSLLTSGSNYNKRVFFASSVIGSPRTITGSNVGSAPYTDFRDITFSSSVSPTNAGNCGGNTNITFPAAKTVYWNLAGTQNWSATAWATSSGGAPSAANFPLAQDTAVINNSGSAGTITLDGDWNIGTLDMSSRTSAVTINSSTGTQNHYGNWTNGSGVTLSLFGTNAFMPTGTAVLTSAGKSGWNLVYVRRGTLQFADAFTSTSSLAFYTSTANTGTFDFNNKTITCDNFYDADSGSVGGKNIQFGVSGSLVITGSGSAALSNYLNYWTSTGSKNVTFTYAGIAPMVVTTLSATPSSNALNLSFTAGTYTLTMSGGAVFGDINFTGFAGSMDSVGNFTVYGNFTASTGMTFASAALTTVFAATSGTKTIDLKGKTYNRNITFNGVGGTWQFLSNWVMTDTTKTVTLTNGTLDLNGSTLTVGGFVTAAGTKNITFNGGTLIVINSGATAFNNAQPTNFTTTAGTGTGTIRLSSATAKTFVGGGSTFNCTLDQGGAGTLTITGSNTFSNITASYTATAACSILFTAATTSTFSNWNASGTVGKLLTIGSVTAASHTLSKSSGTVSADYLSISRSTATGGATWYAGANSTNGGNNTGWIFSAVPSASANFLMFFM